jgi:hypothetical protein
MGRNETTMSAIDDRIESARETLKKNGFITGISQGHLLVDVNCRSANLAATICNGKGLEYLSCEDLRCQTVARFGIA